ncbi:UPF0389 protein GA21628 [Ostrinia nubilalis]|uniref:UPF0389 protein GA21628 n=1 Tax=Ostrinia furnacalis TaxID=93504 RepID=UPI001040C200|nr:UPF0389 protein GA21628 [Ostrinia furnacalis]
MNKFALLRSSVFSAVWKRNIMCQSPLQTNVRGPMSTGYRPTELQKFVLVWTKKFKSKDEIPKFVSGDLIDRARSEARIKLSNILMLMTVLACVGAIISGKSAAKRGESVHQMNLDFHKKYQEEYKKAEETKK